MDFKLNGEIISKKPHACGSNKWQIVRTGADYKLKCALCGRCVFVDKDKLVKMTKTYVEPKEQ